MILNVAAAENTPPGGIGEVLTNIITNMVSNPIGSIVNANYVGILFWAIIFGFGLKKLATAPTKKVIAELSDVATYAVHFVISLAPFGVLGLVFQSVSENGLGIFTTYGKLILLLVGCMALVALVVDPLIVFIAGCSSRFHHLRNPGFRRDSSELFRRRNVHCSSRVP